MSEYFRQNGGLNIYAVHHDNEEGVEIERINRHDEDGPRAHPLRAKKGHRIISVNSKSINDFQDFVAKIQSVKKGGKLLLGLEVFFQTINRFHQTKQSGESQIQGGSKQNPHVHSDQKKMIGVYNGFMQIRNVLHVQNRRRECDQPQVSGTR